MLFTERKARVPFVIEAELPEVLGALMASRAVEARRRAELTAVRVGVAVRAARALRRRPGPRAGGRGEDRLVAGAAVRAPVRTTQLETGPPAVHEVGRHRAERGLGVTARAAAAALDGRRQARCVEAPLVRVGVAGRAADERAEVLGDAAEAAAARIGLRRARMTALTAGLIVRTVDREPTVARMIEHAVRRLFGEGRRPMTGRAVCCRRRSGAGGEEPAVRVVVAARARDRRAAEAAHTRIVVDDVAGLAGDVDVRAGQRQRRLRMRVDAEGVRCEGVARVTGNTARRGTGLAVELPAVRILVAGPAIVLGATRVPGREVAGLRSMTVRAGDRRVRAVEPEAAARVLRARDGHGRVVEAPVLRLMTTPTARALAQPVEPCRVRDEVVTVWARMAIGADPRRRRRAGWHPRPERLQGPRLVRSVAGTARRLGVTPDER